MSIVKNNSGTGDNLRTIKVLSQVDGYNINKYVHLENCGYHLGYVSNSSFYVMMRCELPSGATGYLFGIKNTSGTSGDFYVKCDATTITWAIGSDTWTKARELGVHEYGFVDGKPVYDNALVSTTAVAHSGIHSYTLCIGGVHKTNNTYEYISAIDLYRFNVRYYAIASPTSSSTAWLGAFYPTSVTLRNARKVPEASLAIYHNDGATFSNSASTETVTYGVQLDDLRDITGSGYRDLMAIIAEDNPTEAESSADGPSIASKTGETHNFAFYMGSASSHLPFPSGYTISKQGSTSYDKGELIKGRHPKWSIWNDCIKFGKYGDQAQQGVITYMRFNMLKENTGENVQKVRLENFKDYDTSKNYAPSFDLDGEIKVEYHNNYACNLNANNRLIGNMSGGSSTNQTGDESLVFAFNRASGGIGMVKLGNMPLWLYSKSEQDTTSGLEKLWAIGGGLLLKILDPSGDWLTFATMLKTVLDVTPPDTYVDGGVTYPMPFSTNSSQATKNMFKYDGFDCSSILRDDYIEPLRDIHAERCVRRLKAELMLTSTSNAMPNDGQLIDCSKLLPNKEGSVEGIFDDRIIYNKRSHTTAVSPLDRFVVGEQGGIAKIGDAIYNIGVQGNSSSQNWGEYLSGVGMSLTEPSADFYGYSIALGFGLKSSSNNTLYQIFENGVAKVMAFMDVVVGDGSDGQTSQQSITPQSVQETIQITPLTVNDAAIGTVIHVIENYDTGIYHTKEVSGTTTTYKVYCPHLYNNTEKISIQINCSMSTHTQIEYKMELEQTSDPGNTPILTFNIASPGSTTFSGAVYNCEGTVSVRNGWSSWMKNRYCGFTKLTVAQNSTNYNYPFAYNPKWDGTKLQPWDISASRTSTLAAALFMWKDLLGTRDRIINGQKVSVAKRPQGNDNKALPITCHMRVFPITAGPHNWHIMWNGNRNFDTLSENHYHSTGEMGTIKMLMYHNAGEVINHVGNVVNFVDALISLWPQKSGSYYVKDNQIVAPNSLNGKRVYIYEEPLHEPADMWDFNRDSNDNPIPLMYFDITGLSSSKKTDVFNGKNASGQATDYRCRVTADVTWGGFTRLPIGTERNGETGNTGFFRIEVYGGNGPTSGSTYYIEIQNTPS